MHNPVFNNKSNRLHWRASLFFPLWVALLSACQMPSDAQLNHTAPEDLLFVGHHDGDLDIYLVSADQKIAKLTHNDRDDIHPAWSPDGSKIAYASSEHGAYEIYVMDADGNNKLRITHNQHSDAYPRWAPDGRSLIYLSSRGETDELYRYHFESQQESLLLSAEGSIVEAAFSPDMRYLAYRQQAGKNNQLHIMHLNTGVTEALVADLNVLSFSWSPNVDAIALIGRENRKNNLYLLNLTERSIRMLTDPYGNESTPLWHPMNNEIFYLSARDFRGRAQLHRLVINEGAMPIRLSHSGREEMNLDLSPTGTKLAYVRYENRAYHTYVMDLLTGTHTKIAPDIERTHLTPRFRPRG